CCLDLVFGLMEGWWRFTDTDLRSAYPLLPPGIWQSVLKSVGFTDTGAVSTVGLGNPRRADPTQSVILARTPLTQAGHSPPMHQPSQNGKVKAANELAGGYLILADQGGVGRRLAGMLRGRGARCSLVTPGASYEVLGEGEYRISPERAEDFERLLACV